MQVEIKASKKAMADLRELTRKEVILNYKINC